MASINPLAQDQTKPLGDNNENLTEALQRWLWQLYMDQERQDEICRRNEICALFQRKNYYRGEQYWWYSANNMLWNPPNVAPAGWSEQYQPPAFQNVTNIIKAYSEGLQSVLSQNNTAARFWPEQPSDQNDIATAKNATKAIDKIHRDNDWANRIDECTYYMCTDGFFGSYVRHVTDAERFGADEMDVYHAAQVETGPATVQCASCGDQEDGTTETIPVCPQCGSQMQDVPAPVATVPQYAGTVSIPKGQTVITMVPALNLRRTMYSNEQCDFLYLCWIRDVHKARAMAMYPWVADKIRDSAGNFGGSGNIGSSYEQVARRLLYLGTGRHTGTAQILQDVGELRQVWLRPCVFELVTDEGSKNALKQLFPKGCYVTFYNDVYCQAISECMDECWETMQTCDGEGQIRPTLISDIMPVQDQLNDAVNCMFEQCMNGVPEAFGDQNTIDFEARSQQVAAPGNMTPVDLAPGQDIRSKVEFSPAVEPSVALQKYIEALMTSIPQLLTGYYPALAGGDTGSNDTAAGISIQRNQALARLGKAWRRFQVFCANTDGKAVNCFKRSMTDDIELPKQNNSGDYESDFIRVSDMQGNVVAYPEVDAQYPTLQADIRGLLESWFNSGNPLFLAWMQDPENAEYFLRESGATDLQVPGEDQRQKTYKDIQQLLQEQPSMSEPPVDENGFQQEQPQPIPSITPDPLVDNIPVALDTMQRFLRSDEGLQAKQTNPAGYMNCYLYAKACDQLGKQQQFQQAVVQQGLAGQGPAADIGGAEQIESPPSNNPNELQPAPSPDSPASPA